MPVAPRSPSAHTEPASQSDRPDPDETTAKDPEKPMDESPDIDTAAWEGAEPDEAIGLVDPRPEIPNPPGL